MCVNRLVLQYPISANRYWRKAGARVYVSPEAEQYRANVKLQAQSVATVLVESGDVAVSMSLHPKQPKTQSGKRTRCMDVDNALKVCLDALQGVAFTNDAQIVELRIKRGEPCEGGALVVMWQKA